MSKEKFTAAWHAFLRWPGWTAWLRWTGWGRIAHWSGWKKLLYPGTRLAVSLSVLSAALLVWVFWFSQSENPLAYLIYCLAFYSLTVVCALLPGALKRLSSRVRRAPLAQRYLLDSNQRFRLKLYAGQLVSFLYGLFKLLYGTLSASAWIGADGAYNLVLGVIQLAVILRRRSDPDSVRQWKTYRFCGGLMLVLVVPMAGMVYMAVSLGAHKEYPGYLIFLTALFVFCKLPSAFLKVAKDRRHAVPVDSAVRLLKLSQALFSLFSLQAAMLFQFGESGSFSVLMNTLTGSAVCLLVAGMGIYMLRRGKRDMIRNIQENGHA